MIPDFFFIGRVYKYTSIDIVANTIHKKITINLFY